LVFAGDTAGKISVWDVTDHLVEYVREEDEENDDVDMKTDGSDVVVMETDRSGVAMGTDRSGVAMGTERCRVAIGTENSLISLGTRAPPDMNDSKTLMESDTKCIKDGLVKDISQSSIKQTNSFFMKTQDQTKFSCINLVQNSLGQPLHVFKAHQSGVNDISICKGISV
jgi:hypothetical protein